MTITFNIIFTAQTVFELRAFAWSMLRHSGCRFRLVANALPEDEEALLSSFCARDERLLFHRHPTRKMAEHGDVLNALLDIDDGEWFAFADSDIFAVGPFVDDALTRLGDGLAFFSGVPVWATEADQVAPLSAKRYGGPQNRVASGACLGTSYFAIYRRAPLLEFIRDAGVGMEKTRDASALEARHRDTLSRAGCLVDGYETAKALNLLLAAHGHRLVVDELPGLRHVGGLSLLAKKSGGGRHYVPDDRGVPTGFANPDKPWIPRKRYTCRYLSAHVGALARGEVPDATLTIDDGGVRERVEETAARLVELYPDFLASRFEA